MKHHKYDIDFSQWEFGDFPMEKMREYLVETFQEFMDYVLEETWPYMAYNCEHDPLRMHLKFAASDKEYPDYYFSIDECVRMELHSRIPMDAKSKTHFLDMAKAFRLLAEDIEHTVKRGALPPRRYNYLG